MDLTDRLKAMAEGGHDALDCPPGSTKPPLKEHDCWKAAAEIERLEVERDKFKALHEQENNRANEFYAQAFKANAHNATMQRALEDIREMARVGRSEEELTRVANAALATDAGEKAAKVLKMADQWANGAYVGDHLSEALINAVTAYRAEGQDDG